MPAPRGDIKANSTEAASSLRAMRSKEAAFYGIDSEEFTDKSK